jgi:hypothetical protein
MVNSKILGLVMLVGCATAMPARAVDQTAVGAGNGMAAKVAHGSPLVRSALRYLHEQAIQIQNRALKDATLDALENPDTCVHHRAGLTAPDKQAIVTKLLAEGLFSAIDAAAFPGGAMAGVFPPVADDGSPCPKLPQPFGSAPGSVWGGHHSEPGGLALHEAFNEKSDQSFAENYERNYRDVDLPGFESEMRPFTGLDQDVIVAAPIWHDWAKTIVFQWNADGSEFQEFNFGGAGLKDAWGSTGDSRTGGHHMLSIAEAMARGLAPDMVITQACAHSAPTSGNEFKVVNWLRAAAIIARVDPVAKGYLTVDASGKYRLPPLRDLGQVDLETEPPALNFLPEYTIHNLSDADFTFTGPVVAEAQTLLAALAPRYGYDPSDLTRYNWAYRSTVLSRLSAERIAFLYQRGGLEAVQEEIDQLRAAGVI